jgi:exosome complex component RRP42
MPQHIVLSSITKEYIASLAEGGKRVDGRTFDKYRPIRLRVGHIQKAEGSAEVWLGHTRVLAGVKLKPGVPYPDSPDSGTLTTSAEMNPLAAPDFEAGPPQPEGIELARVVDRGVRESGLIDFKKLCVTPGEKVWTVFLDLHILDYDGNLFDACSIAALAAALSAKVPNKQYGVSEEDPALPLTTQDPPISTTAVKIGHQILLDPSLDEDLVLDARLTVACDLEGSIRAMQKGGHGSFTVDEVKTIIKMSQSAGSLIRGLIKDAVANGEARME